MGKLQTLPLQRQHNLEEANSIFCCQSCWLRLKKEFNFKCFAVLALTISVFFSANFWAFPIYKNKSGFDAKSSIKNSATIQAYFKLQMPVSLLLPHIKILESEINEEIGVPYAKVAILSAHEHGASNHTDVVFGGLPSPINAPMNQVSLSLLKSSFIELFLQKSNLTFTKSIFGQSSDFEILKFPGGITIIPVQSASIWQIHQPLFNFTLHNSISEIVDNFVELQKQLKIGLNLRSYENVYVQVTNEEGSTVDCPVTVQASIMSDLGILLPQRLKQLAQTITQSAPSKNLGLNYTVFGKVKGISLSSYLKGNLQITPPTPSPAPSPGQNEYAGPFVTPVPAPSPPYSLAPSPSDNLYPHAPSPINKPHYSSPPISNSPAPAPDPCPAESSRVPPVSAPAPDVDSAAASVPSPLDFTPIPPSISPPISQLPPSMSPLSSVSYGSGPSQDEGTGKGSVAPSIAPSLFALSTSSSATGSFNWEIWIMSFSSIFVF